MDISDMNMKKLATLVSAVALSATVSANAMAKDTIALVISGSGCGIEL
jgi:ribose transport system substrate-binding protein